MQKKNLKKPVKLQKSFPVRFPEHVRRCEYLSDIKKNFKMPFEEPLAFTVEWFDLTSSLHRQFNLSFYESDSSVEMFDVKTRKMFLRRCVVSNGLDKKDLFVGNTIVVFARHLLIKDYSNDYTRNQVRHRLTLEQFQKYTLLTTAI